MTVPADYRDPTAGEFELQVAIFRSPSPIAADVPVVYLEGGPGGHSLEALPTVFDSTIGPLTQDRDVIAFDQRGTGYSSPSLYCWEATNVTVDLMDEELPFAEELTRMEVALRECRDRLISEGIDLSVFDTAANAADVDRLRAVLGYEAWNLFGVSYGTRLAQTVMRDFPDGVRRVVLDSAYPLEQDLYGSIPASADRAFRLLIDSCASDNVCSRTYPDLGGRLTSAFEMLNESPKPGVAFDARTGAPVDVLVNGDRLVDALFTAFYDTRLLPLLPEVIAEAAEGNVDAVNLILSSELARLELFSVGMHFSVQCQDELPFTSENELVRRAGASSLFNSFMDSGEYGREHFALCGVWDVPSSDGAENLAVLSDIPTLILAGEFDPITPPSAGRAVAGNLSRSTFIEFPGAGHGVITNGECAESVVRLFLAGRDPDTACVKELAGPRWLRPLAQTTVVPYRSELAGVSGVAPEAWLELVPGVFTRTELGVTLFTQMFASEVSSDSLLQLFTAQLGSQLALESIDAAPAGEGEVAWRRFGGEAAGQLVLFATADFGASSGLVFVAGFPSQEDALISRLLAPAVAAFEPLVGT